MKRTAVAIVAALSIGLLAGCADEKQEPKGNQPACDKQDVQWDQESGVYRCPDGTQTDPSELDIDLSKPKSKPKSSTPRSSGRR